MTLRVDINCDAGEGFDDAAIVPYVTSASVACGVHAGNAATMQRTLELAARFGVAAGAHPSLADRAGFGRNAMRITPGEAYDLVTAQIDTLRAHARAAGIRLAHVKPHGALYNMSAANAQLAAAIASAVRDVDASLLLYGLAGSASITEAQRAGVRAVNEGFADRGYEADGTLTPRAATGALITDAEAAADRAVRMVTDGDVVARDGARVQLHAETICIHGDGPNAAATAAAVRAALDAARIRVAAPGAT